MEQRQLDRLGPSMSALGLGCMSIGIAGIYRSSVNDDDAAVRLISGTRSRRREGLARGSTGTIIGVTRQEEAPLFQE